MIDTLKKRFHENMNRHSGLVWEDVEARLQNSKESLEILKRMEESE